MNIRVQDITIKPKRCQQDSVIPLNEVEPQEQMKSGPNVPMNVTVEAAIAFFETNATGDLECLYKRTAGWLKVLLSTQNQSTTTKSREAIVALLKKKQEEKTAKIEE